MRRRMKGATCSRSARSALAFCSRSIGTREPVPEPVGVAEQPRIEEVEQRPELAQVVLDRRAGQAEAVAGVDARGGPVGLAARVLDRLRLVEDQRREAPRCQQRLVAHQQRVGREHDVAAAGSAATGSAGRRRAPAARAGAARTAPARAASCRPGWSARRSAPARPGARASFSATRWAIVCSVLPSPMSSASTPPASCARRCCSQRRPSSWYGRSVARSPPGTGAAARRAGQSPAREPPARSLRSRPGSARARDRRVPRRRRRARRESRRARRGSAPCPRPPGTAR